MDYKKSKSNYVDRDVSWMYFNHRILQESEKEDIPVLERMSYLGIYSNNLDEFFRVRMATLNRMVQSKEKTLKEDREQAKRAIKEITHLNSIFNKEFEKAVEDVTRDLDREGIRILYEDALKRSEEQLLKQLATTDLQLLAQEAHGAVYVVTQHIAHRQEAWLVVLDDAAVGRQVNLTVGEGIEGVDGLV